jgi:uncharacterized protein
MDRGDINHERVRDWMTAQRQELITTPLVVAELDYLVHKHGGARAGRTLHEDFHRGAYMVEWWPSAIYETIAVARRHETLRLGLTDASLVVLAARLQTTTVATLDERHFRALKPLSGADSFTLLPAAGDPA